MKKIFNFILGGALALFVSACVSFEPTGGTSVSESSKASTEIVFESSDAQDITLSSDAATVTVAFNAPSVWTAMLADASASSWLSLSTSVGKIGDSELVITVAANDSKDRTAKICIRSGSDMKYVTVTQSYVKEFTFANGEESQAPSVSCDAGSFDIKFSAPHAWSASVDASWVKLENATGFGDAAAVKSGSGVTGLGGSSTLKISYESNTSLDSREAKIVILCGVQTIVITLTQGPTDEAPDYLYFASKSDGLQMKFYTQGTPTLNTLLYSTDLETWSEVVYGELFPEKALSAGEKVYVKAKDERTADQDYSNYLRVTTNGVHYDVGGNIMYILDPTGTSTEIKTKYAFVYLFDYSPYIESAADLRLPATVLSDYCYARMFRNCSNLTSAPEVIPAETLAQYCCTWMFHDCSSLTSAPELPATTLASYCYNEMFYGCTSLTSAPEVLPATTLADGCYKSMFYKCTSLTSAPELPATTLASYCYNGMFYYCESLTSAPELPATTLAKY